MQHLNATRRRRPRLTVTGLILALCAGVAAAASDSPAEVRAVIEQLRALPLPRIQVTGREESHPGGRGLLPALEQRRQRIYEELHALGPRALPALGRALRARDLSMRRHVVVALDVLSGGWWTFEHGPARLDLRPLLPALIEALQDPDAQVRAWTVQDISDMGRAGRPALPALRRRLTDRNAAVRALARAAIARVGRGP